MITTPRDREVLRTICPGYIAGVAEEYLDHVLDTWLTDDLDGDDHRHVYDYIDEQEMSL